MDALPLELKQRICSFLTPKELKPLRLTSKIFAAAAGRYFINRFILFNCSESVAALREITDHEVFSKHITTLVCDTSFLTASPSCQSHDYAFPSPSWDDYRPRTLVLDDKESYGSLTKGVMRRAHDKYQAACKYWEAKKRDSKVHHERFKALMRNQTSEARHLEMAATIRDALQKCPRLRSLILSGRHSSVIKRRRYDVLGIEVRETNATCYWSRLLVQALGDLSQLTSLTLIRTGMEKLAGSRESITLPNLKHFRINQLSERQFSKEDARNCALVLRTANSLETLSLSLPRSYITNIVNSVRSDRLRICLLCFYSVNGDAMVDFLLHHAATLQRLGISQGDADPAWSPVFSGIAGRMPALQRVQFENLERRPLHYMTQESAQEAERFVAFGGSVPMLRYERGFLGENYEHNRGTYTDVPKRNELLPDLWQDYEGFANDKWDRYN